MNKLVLILCAFFYFFTLNVSAETVNKITITGNKRISDETIKVLGGISNVSEIENSNLTDLLKKLYDSNFFDDIKQPTLQPARPIFENDLDTIKLLYFSINLI